MKRQATASDPRSIITPDAFEVSPELLGLPLATPGKRLAALLIDLAVIGVVTLLTKSFALVLGVVAAVFFVRAGMKRTPVKGSVFGRAMRMSVGCLGLVIGITTAIIWSAVGFGGRGDDEPRVEAGSGIEVGLRDLLSGVRSWEDLRRADDVDEAEVAARSLVHRMRDMKTPDAQIRELLLEIVPRGAAWSSEAPLVIDRAMSDLPDDRVPVDPDIRDMSVAEALEAYAVLLEDEGRADDPRLAGLRARLAEDVAADTMRIMEEEIADLRAALSSQREVVEDLASDLSRERGGTSLFSLLRKFVDELGFGFGWASLYLTVMLSWWRGQTVGKRLVGIRVLRLDGEAITWWTAFERAGGYAAGFATGLLGFAQVYWDANRQAIHDRIVGTVVVVDGAPRVGNWEDAL